MNTLIGADAAKLAGLQVDMLQKLRSGKISLYDLERFVRGELAPLPPHPEIILATQVKLIWLEVYKALGMMDEWYTHVGPLNLSDRPGLWTLPVLKGLTCNKVVATLKKLGVTVHLYTGDLDKKVAVNDRDSSKGAYLVSFRATVEADEEHKSQSADQRKKAGYKDITLLERLLLELAYFMATQQHLDEKNWTLCAGSRYSDGSVPSVSWNAEDRKVNVSWYNPDSRFDSLRARSVVSLPTEAGQGGADKTSDMPNLSGYHGKAGGQTQSQTDN